MAKRRGINCEKFFERLVEAGLAARGDAGIAARARQSQRRDWELDARDRPAPAQDRELASAKYFYELRWGMDEAKWKEFCKDEAEANKWDIAFPWIKNGWKVATDARICIRLPAPGEMDTDSITRFPETEDALFGKFDATKCDTPFPPHSGETKEITCGECKGTGKENTECPDCNGDGEKHCPACDNFTTCGQCSGRGVIPSAINCPVCDGVGNKNMPTDNIVAGKKLAGKYVVLINSLPNVKYWNGGEPYAALHFIADGGLQGLLMPKTTKE